jgi:hypothetical protein
MVILASIGASMATAMFGDDTDEMLGHGVSAGDVRTARMLTAFEQR